MYRENNFQRLDPEYIEVRVINAISFHVSKYISTYILQYLNDHVVKIEGSDWSSLFHEIIL